MAGLKLHDLELSNSLQDPPVLRAAWPQARHRSGRLPLRRAQEKSPHRAQPIWRGPRPRGWRSHFAQLAGDPRLSRAEIWRRTLAAHRARAYGRGRLLADGRRERDRPRTQRRAAARQIRLRPRCRPRASKAERILGLMEVVSQERRWLVLDRPTIADIACMPYIALSHEGGVSLEPYPAIRAWIRGSRGSRASSQCRGYDNALHRHRLLARSQIRAGAPRPLTQPPHRRGDDQE